MTSGRPARNSIRKRVKAAEMWGLRQIESNLLLSPVLRHMLKTAMVDS